MMHADWMAYTQLMVHAQWMVHTEQFMIFSYSDIWNGLVILTTDSSLALASPWVIWEATALT